MLNFLAISLVPYWNFSQWLFNPRLSSLVPLKIVLVECKKHCFRLQKHQGHVFSRKKSPRQGCTTQKTELGMQQQIVYHNPSIRISRYPIWRCRLGWLTGSWQSSEIPSTRIYGWRTVLAPPSTIPYSWVWITVCKLWKFRMFQNGLPTYPCQAVRSAPNTNVMSW